MESLNAAEALKKTPIPAGHVRFERSEYQYGQQGQVTRTGYTLKDIPENEAINWLLGGSVKYIVWPDNELEVFDANHVPMRHHGRFGYGEITRANGKKATGTLSRLPNVFVEYYGPRLITPEERATFQPIDVMAGYR